jgi:hypothetical protein
MDGALGWVVLLVIVSVLLLVASMVADIIDEHNWTVFAEEHHCKQVDYIPSGTGTSLGITSNGQPVVGTVYIPDKTKYECDDGKLYWR